MSNLYDLFQSCFPEDRSRPFLQTPEGLVVSYGDVEELSAQYAGLLLSLGLEPGDRVAVQVDKSSEAVVLYLAVLRVGGVFLPLNTAYTGAELEYFLTDSGSRIVVVQPQSEDAIRPIAKKAGAAHVLTMDGNGAGTLADGAAAVKAMSGSVPRENNDLAAILYTSGTTGRSKGAMLSVENLWSNAVTLRDCWGFTDTDVLLHALPIFHVHGLFVAISCVLTSASTMLFLPKYDADQVIELLPRATTMMGVPTFYTRLLAHPDFGLDTCKNMRLFTSGSAPLLAETWNEFKDLTGHAILERYGMTETGMNTSNPLDGERIPGSVGPALPDVEVRVVDEAGNPLSTDEPGVLEVRGPNVFKGYWRMPEKTAEEFRDDGFFITGDISKIDENGYVAIVGRAKDLIITGGYNVYPKEVEEAIDDLDGVIESAVIGITDPDFGERVVAVVKAVDTTALPDDKKMIADLKTLLAGYKVPKDIIFVDDLPRNVMGKVQKADLRKTYGG